MIRDYRGSRARWNGRCVQSSPCRASELFAIKLLLSHGSEEELSGLEKPTGLKFADPTVVQISDFGLWWMVVPIWSWNA